MILCTKCQSDQWEQVFRCIIDPANDRFKCSKCGHKFKRYDKPETTPAPCPQGWDHV